MKVAVLTGGLSAEREVALSSGKMITAALCRLGHEVAFLDISSQACLSKNYYYKNYTEVMSNSNIPLNGGAGVNHKERSEYSNISLHSDGGGGEKAKKYQFHQSVLEVCRLCDKAFLSLHGGAGENGTVAAVLECNGIAYTGSGVLGSAVAMDKLQSKRLFEGVGIPTPKYTYYRKGETEIKAPCYPCVVKPSDGGSSVGVTIVKNPSDLECAVRAASVYSEIILMEKAIFGREFTVGILDGKALPVTEIIPLKGFYDYDNKYIEGRTKEITPAQIDDKLTSRLRRIAVNSHRALGLGAYSRVDFMVENCSGEPYVLEVNTLPGMTKTSLLPQGAAAVGIDFDGLCERILRSV